MANFTRFNRHEIFNSEDRSVVMKALRWVEDHNTENMLFGLFDGYLYNELPARLEKEDLNTPQITALIEKIKTYQA